MSSELKIVNGRVYDPANNVDGVVWKVSVQGEYEGIEGKEDEIGRY